MSALSSEKISLKVHTIAPAARRWLDETTSARILQIFDRAANLVNDSGEVLSLFSNELGPGPFALVLSPPAAPDGSPRNFTDLLTPTDPVAVRDGRLTIGPMRLHTQDAVLWNPVPDWERLRARPQRLGAALPTLRTLLETESPFGSFAPLALDVTLQEESQPSRSLSGGRRGLGQQSGGGLHARFLEAARDPARCLRDALLAGDVPAASEAATGLAGLGGGNTPSGDDFIMGALYALWATRQPAEVAAIAEALVEAAAPRTVRLSAAYLRAAARAEAGHLWHKLVGAILDGDETLLKTTTRAILGTGHTSGADAFAGFLDLISGALGLSSQ